MRPSRMLTSDLAVVSHDVLGVVVGLDVARAEEVEEVVTLVRAVLALLAG